MEISRVGAAWLVLVGVILGVLLAILAVAPAVDVATVKAGPHASVATHCTPESGWPCDSH